MNDRGSGREHCEHGATKIALTSATSRGEKRKCDFKTVNVLGKLTFWSSLWKQEHAKTSMFVFFFSQLVEEVSLITEDTFFPKRCFFTQVLFNFTIEPSKLQVALMNFTSFKSFNNDY